MLKDWKYCLPAQYNRSVCDTELLKDKIDESYILFKVLFNLGHIKLVAIYFLMVTGWHGSDYGSQARI